jgi:rod shape-determining protein MreB
MAIFSRDYGIDLGTTSVIISARGKGVILKEPSVVAMDKVSGKLLKIGMAAQRMLGRTPGNIVAILPIREGVISDYDMTQRMLREMLEKVSGKSLVRPRVLISVPSGITEVEERAVIAAGIQAGARKVYLMEAPLAAAIGAGIDISDRRGTSSWISAAAPRTVRCCPCPGWWSPTPSKSAVTLLTTPLSGTSAGSTAC